MNKRKEDDNYDDIGKDGKDDKPRTTTTTGKNQNPRTGKKVVVVHNPYQTNKRDQQQQQPKSKPVKSHTRKRRLIATKGIFFVDRY